METGNEALKKKTFAVFEDGCPVDRVHYIEDTGHRARSFYYNYGNVVTQTPISVEAVVTFDGGYHITSFSFMSKDLVSACKTARKCFEIFSRGSLKFIIFQLHDLREGGKPSDEVVVFRSQEDESDSGQWMLFSDEYTTLKKKLGTRKEILKGESCYTEATRQLVCVNDVPCRDFGAFEKAIEKAWEESSCSAVTISSVYLTISWFEEIQREKSFSCEKEVE